MGEKDLAEKQLEEYNDVFADIVNGLLFQGKQVIQPDELQESNIVSQYKADTMVLHEQERDVAKYWTKNNTRIALCGLENQTDIDKWMPMRIFNYEGVSYRSQLLKQEQSNEKISDNEIKSVGKQKGIKQKEKMQYPVVTLVLYFGTKRWNKYTHLKDVVHIPNELEQYVNDIKINVFEIAWLTEEQLNFFQSDFKIVAEYFVQMRKNKRYVPSKKEIKHVDAFMKMMKVFAKDSELDEVLTYFTKNNVEVTNMYEGIKVYKQEGIELGMRQGEEKLSLLMQSLKKDNRMEELMQVIENKKLRQELYLEYHIE